MTSRNQNVIHTQLRFNGEATNLTSTMLLPQSHIHAPLTRTPSSEMAGLDVQLFAVRHDDEQRGARHQQTLAEAVSKAARHDLRSLNGIDHGEPGRLSLLRRLQRGISEAFGRHRHLAMMFIDLHGRETFGANDAVVAAPKLLTVIATRSDDEILESTALIGDPASLLGVAELIRGHIEGRYHLDGREMEIGASIGIAPAPPHSAHRKTLLPAADRCEFHDQTDLEAPPIVGCAVRLTAAPSEG